MKLFKEAEKEQDEGKEKEGAMLHLADLVPERTQVFILQRHAFGGVLLAGEERELQPFS